MAQWALGAILFCFVEASCASPTRVKAEPSSPPSGDDAPAAPAAALTELDLEWRTYVQEGRVSLLRSNGYMGDEPSEDEEDEDYDPLYCSDDEAADPLPISIDMGLLALQGSAAADSVEKENSSDSHKQIQFDTKEQCNSFLNRLAKVSPTKVYGSSEHPIEVSLGQVRSSGKIIFETSSSYCEHHLCASDYLEQWSEVASIVGPLVTIVTKDSSAGGGGGPYHQEIWRSIDSRTGKVASLLDFVDEGSLVAAIKSSEHLRTGWPDTVKAISKLSSWAEVVKALGESDGNEPLELGDYVAFAFSSDPQQAPLVTLILAYPGQLPEEHDTLELAVKANPDVSKYFKAGEKPRFAEERGPHIDGVAYVEP